MSINSFLVPPLRGSSLALLFSYFGTERIPDWDQSDRRSDRKGALYDNECRWSKVFPCTQPSAKVWFSESAHRTGVNI